VVRVGLLVGWLEGVDVGWLVGNLVGRCVLCTPRISGADEVGSEVLGTAVGLEDG